MRRLRNAAAHASRRRTGTSGQERSVLGAAEQNRASTFVPLPSMKWPTIASMNAARHLPTHSAEADRFAGIGTRAHAHGHYRAWARRPREPRSLQRGWLPNYAKLTSPGPGISLDARPAFPAGSDFGGEKVSLAQRPRRPLGSWARHRTSAWQLRPDLPCAMCAMRRSAASQTSRFGDLGSNSLVQQSPPTV